MNNGKIEKHELFIVLGVIIFVLLVMIIGGVQLWMYNYHFGAILWFSLWLSLFIYGFYSMHKGYKSYLKELIYREYPKYIKEDVKTSNLIAKRFFETMFLFTIFGIMAIGGLYLWKYDYHFGAIIWSSPFLLLMYFLSQEYEKEDIETESDESFKKFSAEECNNENAKHLAIELIEEQLRKGNDGDLENAQICFYFLVKYKFIENPRDIDRISKILYWVKFRDYHPDWSWNVQDVLKALQNRSIGSKADKAIEDFKQYCKEVGKEFPNVIEKPAGMVS